ncbi:MAG: helix-hairpin-helix domain-containing protein [Bacteroidales bacterium]|nr:helix-hairpin-helix domain-containing protein [Bacteroidales bacterium]
MKEGKGFSESFIVGVIAVVFLVIGYQTALFIHRAAVMKVAAGRDEPDTVFVYRGVIDDSGPDDVEGGYAENTTDEQRKNGYHTPRAESVREKLPRKKVESFRFDPNTVSIEELCRLGFTPKQAQAICNYREKGGRFRRKTDFAKSFVVSDSLYRRLEQYIDIPLVDLNLADSAAFDALPGIGGWFASMMIEHRNALGGYSYKEQLMDIYRFDQEKFDAMSDLITVSQEHVTPYPFWTVPADSLSRHPYIEDIETARAIVLFRENTPSSQHTVESLVSAGIISLENARKLMKCALVPPEND